jgi:glutaminyl-peptide cyclotransferase
MVHTSTWGHGGSVLRFCLATVLAFSFFVPTSLAYTQLSEASLRKIPSGGDDFDIHNGALLAPLLIPRVPGTVGSHKAQQHFADFFQKHLPKWTLEWHNFTDKTPATGDRDVPFANLILRRDPPWAASGEVSRLTLVAHYDSLYKTSMGEEGFIGATDSAASCAMLMHVARNLDEALTKKWEQDVATGDAGSGLEEEKGVQILLLDGEEAWVSWTDTDSTYGSR